jgi:hypothetical protein
MYQRVLPSNASHITPLTFVHVPGSDHSDRRRGRSLNSLRSGWGVEGNLETLGYYSADVCIGNPSKTFNLIVDTGSSLTAMPCGGCPHCGYHISGAKLEGKSRTFKKMSCTEPPSGTCTSCNNNVCGYTVSYTEGSSIRGDIIQDEVHFAHDGGRVSAKAWVGCQMYESGLFYKQKADGITGFAQPPRGGGWNSGTSLFGALIRETKAPATFSICLASYTGAMVLGGKVRDDSTASWVYYNSGSYAPTITDFSVNGKSMGECAP